MHTLSLSGAYTIAFSSFSKATYFHKCSVWGLEYILFHQKESQSFSNRSKTLQFSDILFSKSIACREALARRVFPT